MKIEKHITLLFFVIMLLMACGGHQYESKLIAADSLAETAPDSAMSILSTIDYSSIKEDEYKAQYGLLYTIAMYKSYKPVASDSLIDFSIRYYAKYHDIEHLANSYYYKAAVDYDRQTDVDKVLGYLKKAEELCVKANDELLKSKVYNMLYYINSNAGCDKLALNYAKLFTNSAMRLSDLSKMALGYGHIANAYYTANQPDSAYAYFKKSLPAMKSLNRKSQAIQLSNLGYICYEYNDVHHAEEYAILSLHKNDNPIAFLTLGNICNDKGDTASAKRCWDKAIAASADNNTKIMTYQSMIDYYKQHGDYRRVYDLTNAVDTLKEKIDEKANNIQILEIQAKYDSEKKSKNLYKHISILSGSTIFLFLVVITVVYIYRRAIKNYKNKINYKNQKISDYLNQIHRYSVMKEKLVNDLNSYLSQINNYAKKINRNNLEINKLKISDKHKEKEIQSLLQENESIQSSYIDGLIKGKYIYEQIIKREDISHYSTADIEHLIDFFKIIKEDVFKKWAEQYENLTTSLYLFLILFNEGFSYEDISLYLNIKETTIRSIRSRLRKRSKQ